MSSRASRHQWFAIVGKPNKYIDDSDVMGYIASHPGLFPEVAYILHDRDLDVEEDIREQYFTDKNYVGKDFVMYNKVNECESSLPVAVYAVEPHVHMLFKTVRVLSLDSLLKLFVVNGCPKLHYAKIIDVPEAYLHYMIHQSFSSSSDPFKTKYDPAEVKGTPKLISKLYADNLYFVQFSVFRNILYSTKNRTKDEFIEKCHDYASGLDPPQQQKFYESLHYWGFLMMNWCNSSSKINTNKDEKYEYYDENIGDYV